MGQDQLSLYFDKAPSLAAIFLKAFASTKPRYNPNIKEQPCMSAHASGLKINDDHLKSYEEICDFNQKEFVPTTYIQMMANPIMVAMITHQTFPFKALGLIHTQHKIVQHRPVRRYEPIDVTCFLNGFKEHEDHIEFEVLTHASIDQKVVWQSVGTYISRNPKTSLKRTQSNKKQVVADTVWQQKEWELDYYLGQRYARISGDYNPIHLHKRTARMFGFRRHIIHGMWTLAHCAAQFHGAFDKFKLEAKFIAPIFLPSKLDFLYDKQSDKISFQVSNPRNKSKVYVNGSIEKAR